MKKEIGSHLLDSALAILKNVDAKMSTAMIVGSAKSLLSMWLRTQAWICIAMGAMGINGIKPLFIGRVTGSVAADSTKRVLVVRPPMATKPNIVNILFATDGSEDSVGREHFCLYRFSRIMQK